MTAYVYGSWVSIWIAKSDRKAAMDWLHFNGCHYWQEENPDPDQIGYKWFPEQNGGKEIRFVFNNLDIATRFKLTWA
jgi:hypothetical protein